MALEIEAKYRMEDPEPLRRRLPECGAERLGAVLETNRFFDWPDRSLLAGDRGLRVRSAVPEPSEPGEPVVTVTYKGPREDEALKIREELTFEADSADNAAAVFESLGLVTTLTFEKCRESWRLGDCAVELDEVPLLGRFVEIEGPTAEAVHAAAAKLGFADEPVVLQPYVALLAEHLKRLGRSDRAIAF